MPTWAGGAPSRVRVALQVGSCVLALLIVVAAFHRSYMALRAGAGVVADDLLSYNELLDWWRHGHPLTGYTLTPSPYFVDLALQLPLAILAPDFEWFAYGLALLYAIALFTTTALLVRRTLAFGVDASAITGAVCVAAYYQTWPPAVLTHVFVQNHTSEVFCTLAILLFSKLVIDGASTARRQRIAVLAATYTCAIGVFVASSPFFIATYCVPMVLAGALVIGTAHFSARRYASLVLLTALGSALGLGFDAWLAHHILPIRIDEYALTPVEAAKAAVVALSDPSIAALVLVAAVVILVSGAGAVWHRCRSSAGFVPFVLAFLPCSAVACIGLPVVRGAFDSGYAIRFVQLPLYLATALAVAGVVVALRHIGANLLKDRSIVLRLSAKSRACALAGMWLTAALLLVAVIRHAGTPLDMDDPRSTTAAMIDCVRRAELEGVIHSGVSTVFVARFINAAHHARRWRSPNDVVQLELWRPPTIVASENNSHWIVDDRWEGGGTLDFLATHGLPDESLAYVKEMVGRPQSVRVCPAPPDMRLDQKPSFEIWSWTDREARERLTHFVTRSNTRGPFMPWRAATKARIDPVWGMQTRLGEGRLVDGRRVWRRGEHSHGGEFALTQPMFIPAGRYRAHLELSGHATSQAPFASVTIFDGARVAATTRAPAGATALDVDFSSQNRGSTSGRALVISVRATDDAELVELGRVDLERLSTAGVDPFRIFR